MKNILILCLLVITVSLNAQKIEYIMYNSVKSTVTEIYKDGRDTTIRKCAAESTNGNPGETYQVWFIGDYSIRVDFLVVNGYKMPVTITKMDQWGNVVYEQKIKSQLLTINK